MTTNRHNYSWLYQAIVNGGLDEPRSYSGRFMYGKKCLGVTGDNLPEIIANILDGLAEDDSLAENGASDLRRFTKLLRESRTDSMGLGVVLYFPSVAWDDAWDTSDENEDEESDDDTASTTSV